jgi:hypothetical protein
MVQSDLKGATVVVVKRFEKTSKFWLGSENLKSKEELSEQANKSTNLAM